MARTVSASWALVLLVACSASHVEPAPDAACVAPPEVGIAPASCAFVVRDCCYPDGASACAAAGCAPDRCTLLESHPVQVRCE